MATNIQSARTAWEPQPKQREALECPAYELFYGGARGGGKSDFLLGDFLSEIDEYGSDHRGVIFRRTYPELEELIGRAKEIYLPCGAEYSETKKLFTFPSGATLKMRYVERHQDVHHYQGHQYSWIGFDELTNWPDDYVYIYMHSCARSAAGVPVRVRATGNPGNVGHAWVKSRFVDPSDPYEIWNDTDTGLTRCFIPARLEDNLRMDERDPDYEHRLEMLPDHLYKAYRLGDWTVFVGQVFSEFRYDDHVIKPFKLEPVWHKFLSMDWGYVRPFSVGWWAVTGDGRMIRYREWYGCERGKPDVGIQMSPDEVARKAWEISSAEGATVMVADPACWQRQGHQNTIADYFANVGFEMEKAVNDRVSGLARVHDMLKTYAWDRRPMMMAFDTCKDWIRLMPIMVADEKNIEDVDTHQEDHAYDETRYAVMSQQSQLVNQRPDLHSDMFDARIQARRMRRRTYDPQQW